MPNPPAAASSEEAQAMPPAPRSLNPNATFSWCSHSSTARFASRRTRFRKGSGTWTCPRCPSAFSSSTADANEAPPNPVSSVGFPTRIRTYGSREAASGTRLRTTRSARTNPSETTFTRQFSSKRGEKKTSPPRLGTPSASPYCQIPSTTPRTISRTGAARGPSGSPNRSASRTPITSAPMQATSRTMPPIPVAAPSVGTTCDG